MIEVTTSDERIPAGWEVNINKQVRYFVIPGAHKGKEHLAQFCKN